MNTLTFSKNYIQELITVITDATVKLWNQDNSLPSTKLNWRKRNYYDSDSPDGIYYPRNIVQDDISYDPKCIQIKYISKNKYRSTDYIHIYTKCKIKPISILKGCWTHFDIFVSENKIQLIQCILRGFRYNYIMDEDNSSNSIGTYVDGEYFNNRKREGFIPFEQSIDANTNRLILTLKNN